MKVVFFLPLCLVFATIFSGCMEANPFAGKWSDNENTITLTAEKTFMANFASEGVTRDGNYSVSNNVLVFNYNDGQVLLTEWDLRGSILYIYVQDENDLQNPLKTLVLYKVG